MPVAELDVADTGLAAGPVVALGVIDVGPGEITGRGHEGNAEAGLFKSFRRFRHLVGDVGWSHGIPFAHAKVRSLNADRGEGIDDLIDAQSLEVLGEHYVGQIHDDIVVADGDSPADATGTVQAPVLHSTRPKRWRLRAMMA